MADLDAEIAATRDEISQVNSGSKREGELQAKLDAYYQQRYPSSPSAPAGPTPRPDGFTPELAPADAALAETNVRAVRLEQLQAERELFGNTTARNRALDIEIEDILRADFEAQKSLGAEPDIITVASVRPELPAGATWDEKVMGRFQQEAPGALVLMHTAADALREAHRSGQRWDDAVAAGTALEDRWGVEEAGQLAEDAMAYAKAHVSPEIQANLRAHGVLYHPDVIRAAAQLWRRQQR
jgi:hypothetical protein